MPTEKRQRGRPRGSGKDDSVPLAEAADLIVRDSSLKATTGMNRVLCRRNDWGATDATLIRRWQAKWKLNRNGLFSAAHERARPMPTAPMRTHHKHFAFESLCGIMESPCMKAIQAQVDAFNAMQDRLNIPAFKALQDRMNSFNAMQDRLNIPSFKAMQDDLLARTGVLTTHDDLLSRFGIRPMRDDFLTRLGVRTMYNR